MAIDAGMMEILDEFGDHYNVKVIFSDEQKQVLPEVFGDYVISIDFPEFLPKFEEWFKNQKLPLITGLVNYEDLSYNSKKRWELFERLDPPFVFYKK